MKENPYQKTINADDILEILPIFNRIAEVLKEKNIDPLISEEDLKAMNLKDIDHWFRLLRNEEEPNVFGEDANLFRIMRWLGVHEFTEIYKNWEG